MPKVKNIEFDNCVVCGVYLSTVSEEDEGMCIDCFIDVDKITKQLEKEDDKTNKSNSTTK